MPVRKEQKGLTEDTAEMDRHDGTDWMWAVGSEREGGVREGPTAESSWLSVHSALLHPGHSLQPQLGILGHCLFLSFLIDCHPKARHSEDKSGKIKP